MPTHTLKILAVVLSFSACISPVDVGKHEQAVCTVGIAMSCNGELTGGGIGGVAGDCVEGDAGPECVCSSGYSKDANGKCIEQTAVCTPGIAMSCNGHSTGGIGGVAGNCVAGILGPECVCNAGFTKASNGKCDEQASVCTVGVAMSCNGNIDSGIGGVGGNCVAGSAGPECVCNVGFVKAANGKCERQEAFSPCTVGQDETCNALQGLSSLAGRCVAQPLGGNACECKAGFALDNGGKCAVSVCLVSTGPTSCQFVMAVDDSPAPSGTCGSMSVSPGCACGKDSSGAYRPMCTGACPSQSRTCFTYNCGSISCVDGQTSCGSVGVCQ